MCYEKPVESLQVKYGLGLKQDCYLPLSSELTNDMSQVEPKQRQFEKVMQEQDKFNPHHYLNDNYDPDQL